MLLAAAAVVWGSVAWMILSESQGAGSSEPPATATAAAPAPSAPDTLRCDYPDPFTRNPATKAHAAGIRTGVRGLPRVSEPAGRVKLRAEHLGTIRVRNRTFHILMLDGRQYELRCGESTGDFVLKRVDADSLYLLREGRVYGVKRCE